MTYELLSQDGSTVHVHRNHLIPYYPKEPLLYPHLRRFMRFSDTTQFHLPKQIKYANSGSSPLTPDESLSDENSSQTFMTPLTTSNQNSFPLSNQNVHQTSRTPFITSNQKSSTPFTNDNPSYKRLINTPQPNISIDRSRHQSQDQPDSFPPPIDRTTKTHYTVRHQPNLDYRLFIPPSKL